MRTVIINNEEYMTINQASQALNLCRSRIYGLIKEKRLKSISLEHGKTFIHKASAQKYPSQNLPINEEEIIKDYKNNISLRTLFKKYRVGNYKIQEIFKKHNIKIRTAVEQRTKHSPLQQDFFKIIDSEIKAYFLGLLWADGCNVSSHKNIQLSLIEKDKEVLEKISKLVLGHKNVSILKRKTPRQNSARFYVHSQKWCETLDSYGFNKSRNKSKGLPNVNIPKKIFHHFLRGLWDGDGSIYFVQYSQDWASQFIGSVKICEEIKNKLFKYYGFNINIVEENNYSFPMKRLTIHGSPKTQAFLDLIYSKSTIYLSRKYDRYQKLTNR